MLGHGLSTTEIYTYHLECGSPVFMPSTILEDNVFDFSNVDIKLALVLFRLIPHRP